MHSDAPFSAHLVSLLHTTSAVVQILAKYCISLHYVHYSLPHNSTLDFLTAPCHGKNAVCRYIYTHQVVTSHGLAVGGISQSTVFHICWSQLLIPKTNWVITYIFRPSDMAKDTKTIAQPPRNTPRVFGYPYQPLTTAVYDQWGE